MNLYPFYVGDDKLNGSEFVMSMMAGGMTMRTSLYVFFLSDNNTDMFVDMEEEKHNFHSMDMNRRLFSCLIIVSFI